MSSAKNLCVVVCTDAALFESNVPLGARLSIMDAADSDSGILVWILTAVAAVVAMLFFARGRFGKGKVDVEASRAGVVEKERKKGKQKPQQPRGHPQPLTQTQKKQQKQQQQQHPFLVAVLTGHVSDIVTGAALSSDGLYAATAAADETVWVHWADTIPFGKRGGPGASGSRYWRFKLQDHGCVSALAFSDDCHRLICAEEQVRQVLIFGVPVRAVRERKGVGLQLMRSFQTDHVEDIQQVR